MGDVAGLASGSVRPAARLTALRSFLFVPGDSERKLAKGGASGADALILDLEDAVAASRTAIARRMVLEYLQGRPDRSHQQLWVRINPLSTPAAMLSSTSSRRARGGSPARLALV